MNANKYLQSKSSIGFISVTVLLSLGSPAFGAPDYSRDILPILSNNCYPCHGPDENKRESEFRFDIIEDAIDYGAITPGDPDDSLLIEHIFAEKARDLMPPPESNKVLTETEKQLLKEWIAAGAEYRPHWAFQAPSRPGVPASVTRKDWARGGLDAFILNRLEREGLAPSREADKETLIRRVTFDLTGLPPTLEEVDAFTGDSSADSYERVVDRLLKSPRYGEHMAAQWLDVARFADTFGYQNDVVNELWPWREWVIGTFNANMPYDQFVTEQLAGDLLQNPTQDQLLATAFNRLHRQTNEGGSVDEEYRLEYVSDRTQTFSTAFMGIALECARCHDHKFDPISQVEYYALTAFFDNIDESGIYSHYTRTAPTPALDLFRGDAKSEHDDLMKAIADAESVLQEGVVSDAKKFNKWLKKRKRVVPELAPEVHFTFDDAPKRSKIRNAASEEGLAQVDRAFTFIEDGKVNGATRFTGENSISIEEVAAYDRYHPFSIATWIYIEETLPHMIVAHRTKAASDAASRGYEFMLDDDRLTFGLVYFWPGDALRVQSKDALPLKQWVHVVATYDGSSRASGIHLYIDGKESEFDTLRDTLHRTIWYNAKGDDPPLMLGARSRDNGFKNGRLDEFMVFPYAITALEVQSMVEDTPIAKVVAASIKKSPASDRLRAFYTERVDENAAEKRALLLEARKAESKRIDAIPQIMVMREMPGIRPTHLLHRGEYTRKGDLVTAGAPPQLFPFSEDLPKNRLGLARWLLDPKHPLTARVAVNRLWQQCFGQGIVVTAEDFGVQGDPPSHPELLDYLAIAYRDSGWDTKAMLRTLVLSSTYRQESGASKELLERDPNNILLARGARYRRSAEEIRDAALASSGLLVAKIGGRSVKPYQPEGIWKDSSSQTYTVGKGDDLYRRTLYTFIKRTMPPPSMLTFDATSREVCVVRRERTTTPLQALVLLNDPQYVEAARILADRVLSDSSGKTEEDITTVFRSLLTRYPRPEEIQILNEAYNEQLAYFQSSPDRSEAYRSVGDRPADEALNPAEAAALTAIAQALMNHDEFQVKQ